MKKMILMAVALLSMTTAFAGNDNVEEVRKAYTIDVNAHRLGSALHLNYDQFEAVDYYTEAFCRDMRYAGYGKAAKRQDRLNRAIRKNLAGMRSVLNKEQYRTYVMLLNSTLSNRGLM